MNSKIRKLISIATSAVVASMTVASLTAGATSSILDILDDTTDLAELEAILGDTSDIADLEALLDGTADLSELEAILGETIDLSELEEILAESEYLADLDMVSSDDYIFDVLEIDENTDVQTIIMYGLGRAETELAEFDISDKFYSVVNTIAPIYEKYSGQEIAVQDKDSGDEYKLIRFFENELPFIWSTENEEKWGYAENLKQAYDYFGFDVTPYIFPDGFTPGDFDCDGAINASDASTVLSAYTDISIGDLNVDDLMGQIEAADFNKDGKIDASDASAILAYYADLATGEK